MVKNLGMLAVLWSASVVFAATQAAPDKEILEDIAKHEKIAAAHTEAARCLKSGKSHDECNKALQQACKGIAIGRYCGMRH